MKKPEPVRLRRGKAFHAETQREWEAEAAGEVTREKGVTKSSGRPGRIDIHVQVDGGLSVVIEIKDSDWDAMSPAAVRRNIKRYARQIWSYIKAELENGQDVSPGIVLPRRPLTAGRLHEIERLFDEEGIPVVWQDETIEERRDRAVP